MRKSLPMELVVEGSRSTFVVSGDACEWRISALDITDASFSWSTFELLSAWVSTVRPCFDHASFSDRTFAFRDGKPSAVLVAVIDQGYLFGFDGAQGFWGGAMSKSTVMAVIAAIESIRTEGTA